MTRIRVVALAAFLLCGAPLFATIQRTFIASTGSDTNTCARDQPCRNFVAALAQTTAGGEVVVLDSAGYGAIPAITQSVSIIAPLGVHAAMTVFSGDGITINAPSANVVLRNLYLTGLGGNLGINIQDAKSVVIERTFVTGFGSSGIRFGPTPSTADMMLVDSVVRNNTGDGVDIGNTSSSSILDVATIIGCRIESNFQNGLIVLDGGRASVRDSLAIHNTAGFDVNANSTTNPSVLELESCTAYHNYYGVFVFQQSGASGTIRLSNCSVVLNIGGLLPQTGQILSRQNNTVEGNTTDGAFTGTYMAK